MSEGQIPAKTTNELQKEAYERSIEYLQKEADRFKDAKTAWARAKYHETMKRICEYECQCAKLENTGELTLDADLVAIIGEEKARMAHANNQVPQVKKLIEASKAGKLSVEELAFIIECGAADKVGAKEIE